MALGTMAVSPPLTAAPELLGGSFDIGPARSYLLQSLLILGVILTGLYLLTRVMKKNGRFSIAGAQRIKLVEGISLGGQERAVIISIDGRELLLGTTPGRVVTLAELGAAPKPEAAGRQDEPQDRAGQADNTRPFAELLQRPADDES